MLTVKGATTAPSSGSSYKCPSLFVRDVLDWNIEDPKGKTIEDVRKIRDQIKLEVLSLIKKLEDDS